MEEKCKFSCWDHHNITTTFGKTESQEEAMEILENISTCDVKVGPYPAKHWRQIRAKEKKRYIESTEPPRGKEG